ncbi:AzlD domain-containing protein [Tissierella praeacuta]|uniref:AzlD domain-containing protein n=2 Tax=Tissierella praeacuta TaxID=43131 RepID=UPI0028AD8A26|nr:AzlD domain-containing protein [Tissierella praeacuta]
MKNYLPLIIAMTLVTYLPRLMPLMLLSNRKVNKYIKQFLLYIPYTSLSILIIRGIITAAAIISYIKGNLVLSVLAGILLSFLTINTLV